MTINLSEGTWRYKNFSTNKEETFEILNTSNITRSCSLALIPADQESVAYLCEKINDFKDKYNPPSATLIFDASFKCFVFKTPVSNHLTKYFFLFTTELGATEDFSNKKPNK